MRRTWTLLLATAVFLALLLALAACRGADLPGGEKAVDPFPPVETPVPLPAEEGFAAREDGVETLPAGEGAAVSAAPGGEDVAPPLSDLAGRKIIRNATLGLAVDDVLDAV